MRILFIGDIVGLPGVNLVRRAVPWLVVERKIDCVIANAENAAGGSGITIKLFRKLRHGGVDLLTLGDHIYKKAEIYPVLEAEACVCKPANFPSEAPGRDFAFAQSRCGEPVVVVSVLGRTFMRPVDCPFKAVDRVLQQVQTLARVIVVDVHAEATADKYLLAHHLKGRVAAVLGTHTHVPTADEQIFPPGTAFQCDVGMTGPHDGILGRRTDRVLGTTVNFIPSPFDVAENDVRLSGALVEVNEAGRATKIERIQIRESEVPATEG
jgi:hypothetical protein